MGFLLDIFKIVLAKETEESTIKLVKDAFLARTKAKLRQHLKKPNFSLEEFFNKFNLQERISLEKYLQQFNLKDVLLTEYKKHKNNLQAKYNLSNTGFGQIVQLSKELKANEELIKKSPEKPSSHFVKGTAGNRPEPRFNIKFGLISEALAWGMFIPLIRERTKFNKYADFRGIVKLKFRTSAKVYDYYNISWKLFTLMLEAQGPTGGEGAWSVYNRVSGNDFKRRTQRQIKAAFERSTTARATKSRRYIRTNIKVPKIKGIKKVQKKG